MEMVEFDDYIASINFSIDADDELDIEIFINGTHARMWIKKEKWVKLRELLNKAD